MFVPIVIGLGAAYFLLRGGSSAKPWPAGSSAKPGQALAPRCAAQPFFGDDDLRPDVELPLFGSVTLRNSWPYEVWECLDRLTVEYAPPTISEGLNYKLVPWRPGTIKASDFAEQNHRFFEETAAQHGWWDVWADRGLENLVVLPASASAPKNFATIPNRR